MQRQGNKFSKSVFQVRPVAGIVIAVDKMNAANGVAVVASEDGAVVVVVVVVVAITLRPSSRVERFTSPWAPA